MSDLMSENPGEVSTLTPHSLTSLTHSGISPSEPSQEFPIYWSIRLTLEHAWWSKVYTHLVKDQSYVAFPHSGTKTEKEHWHVLIPVSGTPNDKNVRNVIDRHLGLRGNKQYSLKLMKNGIASGIAYGKHDQRKPPKCSADLESLLASTPAIAVQRQTRQEEFMKTDVKKVRDWQLTYSNLVAQAVNHYHTNHMSGVSLKDTIKHMCMTTKWRPSVQLVRNGVDMYYEHDFQYRIGHVKTFNMDWWTPRDR